MGKNTSKLLGDHLDDFISSEIKPGKYSSANEVVRTALRLLELEEQKIFHLRRELELGEQSPMIENYDPAKHLQDIHKKHQ